VCDLIEEKRPPGIFAALNDACATAHADPTAADNSFIQRSAGLSSNPHFESRGAQFLVKHYAGDVMYNIQGMTDKNKDALVKDLWDLIGASGNQFLQGLFTERPDPTSKKRPPTAGDRIKVFTYTQELLTLTNPDSAICECVSREPYAVSAIVYSND
jgi:myosin I